MEKNKSKWYIKRFVTTVYASIGPSLEATYDVRDDKEPEEVEVGDTVVLPFNDSKGHSWKFVGKVVKIGLYDDGVYKILVDSHDYDHLFLTTPDRIGILKKADKR